MKTYEFDAVIQKQENIDGAYIEFPYNVEEEFGAKGQVKVKVTFDGYEYQGSLVKMGHPCHCVGITKKIRSEINKQPGDTVHIVLVKDDSIRTVEIPKELKELLEVNKEASDFFYTLSYSNQKKYTDWVSNAKREETKEKRLKEAIEMLSKRIKRL